MSDHSKVVVSRAEHNASLRNYVTGFVLSVSLTLIAYVAVTGSIFNRRQLIALISCLAFVQFVVQLVFFLHLGRETKPRWKLFVFLFMVLIVGIIVVGSLWIMNNLNYRMTPEEMTQYLESQEGL